MSYEAPVDDILFALNTDYINSVQHADVKGYSYSRGDVTAKALALLPPLPTAADRVRAPEHPVQDHGQPAGHGRSQVGQPPG